MQFCLPVAKRPLLRVLRTTGVRSIGSKSSPTAPPGRSASNVNPEEFKRTPEEIRLMSHTGDESQVRWATLQLQLLQLQLKCDITLYLDYFSHHIECIIYPITFLPLPGTVQARKAS
jgi:hypothetical protein